MNRKTKLYTVAGILFAAFSAATFLAPFPKSSAVFWVCYFAEVIAVAAQIPIFRLAFHGDTARQSKVYGFPIFRIGYLYLFTQTGVSLLFMVITWAACKLDKTPVLWLPLLICILLMLAAALGCIATATARDAIEQIGQTETVSTAFMYQLRDDAQALAGSKDIPEQRKLLQTLAENIRYSDPVSSPAVADEDAALQRQFLDLQTAVRNGADDISARIKAVQQALDSRNRAVKAKK